MYKALTLAAVVTITAFSACSESETETPVSAIVVASVNGKEIYGDRFLVEYKHFKRKAKIANPDNPKVENRLRDGLIRRIIDTDLLLQEAAKAGIEVSNEERDKSTAEIIQGFSSARLQLILEKTDQSLDEWKDVLHRNMVIERLIQTKIAPLVDIPEKEIRKYYRDNLDKFKIPARVHASHIVANSLSQADEIRNELLYGANFSELAVKNSKSPDAANGGDLGIFAKGQMPSEFDEVLFKLKINQISKVVESPYGYHIFKVSEKFKPRGMKYEKARKKIFNEMFNERLEEKFSEWMIKTREKADIIIYTQRLYGL